MGVREPSGAPKVPQGATGGPRETPASPFIPPQRRVAILGVCAWGGGGSASRLSAHRPSRPVPCPCTWPLCGSHTGCVAATQGVLLRHNSTLWLLRSHNSCVGCIKKLYAVYTRYITRPESAGKHRFWHERGREATIRAETLCGESCAPQDASRMPRLPKNQKIRQKTGVWAIFGPRPPGPISPWMRCAAGWCDSTIYIGYTCLISRSLPKSIFRSAG